MATQTSPISHYGGRGYNFIPPRKKVAYSANICVLYFSLFLYIMYVCKYLIFNILRLFFYSLTIFYIITIDSTKIMLTFALKSSETDIHIIVL